MRLYHHLSSICSLENPFILAKSTFIFINQRVLPYFFRSESKDYLVKARFLFHIRYWFYRSEWGGVQTWTSRRHSDCLSAQHGRRSASGAWSRPSESRISRYSQSIPSSESRISRCSHSIHSINTPSPPIRLQKFENSLSVSYPVRLSASGVWSHSSESRISRYNHSVSYPEWRSASWDWVTHQEESKTERNTHWALLAQFVAYLSAL